MKFQVKDLRKILSSVQNNNVDQIKITSDQFELIVNKTLELKNQNIVKQRNYINKNSNTNLNAEKSNLEHSKKTTVVNSESETYSTIVSPMVGTFYKSPAPNEPPFVEPYDVVEKKQTVCIIEAMKLMNEIEAEVHGEIVEILVQDGDIVDCGQALMKVKTV